MIALDVSGSMGWDAYVDSSLNTNKIYEGLFNPNKNYKYSNGVWEETTQSAVNCPTPVNITNEQKCCSQFFWFCLKANGDCLDKNKTYSGNCLNYWIMTRIDVFRWAMTGGVPDECKSASKKCNPQQAFKNETHGIIKTHSGEKIKIPLEGEHGIFDAVLYDLEKKELRPRIGIMTYADRENKKDKKYVQDTVYVGDFIQATSISKEYPYNNLITVINTAKVEGGTPSGPAMWDVWNYYLQKDPEYGGLAPDKGSDASNHFKDPLWICENIGRGLTCNYAPCSNNYVILASDGQWNTPSTYIDNNCNNPNSLSDNCRSPDPVVPAYKMHMGKTREKDGANVKIDAVYALGMFLGGTGEQALKNVAMYGSFNKALAGNWPDDLNGFPMDECIMDDGGRGKGSACTDLPPSSPDWDADGDNVPDTFYSANDALELKNQLTAIFADILSRASSGSALGTVSTETRTSSMLFQAFYYPVFNDETGKEISWIGDLRSYFLDENYNIREDTDKNKILNYGRDKILFFKFFEELSKTMALKIDDIDQDAIPDQCSLPSDGVEMLDVNSVFSISDYLKNLATDNRVIMYNKSGPGNSGPVNIENNFTVANADDIKTYWGISDNTYASKLIKFIRGYDFPKDNNFRKRHFIESNNAELYTNVYKLGDIINSTPQILSNTAVNMYHFIYRDWSYYEYVQSETVQNREPVVFFGANDGMVHAVSIGKIKDLPLNERPDIAKLEGDYIGKELWAFIPKNALAYLQWYNIEDASCHVPKVDYRFQLTDAKIGENDSWRTLLIGTMGFGGKSITVNNNTYSSSIFVIDVTDPLNSKFLWEEALPDHSLTLSFPSIVKQKNDWYLAIGSGPLNPSGNEFVTNPKLYFYDLKTGVKTIAIDIPENKVAVGDILSLDVDHDYNVDALVFGTYGSPNSTKGNLYMLHIRNGENNYIDISSLGKSNISTLLAVNKPIFASITDAFDESNNLWLYGGTGRFLSQEDKADTSSQMIFGIKINNDTWKGISPETIYESDLFNSTNIEVEADIQEVRCYCLGVDTGLANFDFDTNSYTCSYSSDCELVVTKTSAGVTTFSDQSGTKLSVNALGNYISNNYKGWKNYLDSGERVYSKQLLMGGLLDTIVFKPVNDLCSIGGTSYVVATDYKSGTATAQPSFLNESGTIEISYEENKVKIVKKQSLGFGAPPIGKSISPMPPKEGETKFTKLIQTSGGTVIKQEQQSTFSPSSKIIHMITR
jgi:type IV pilus assembly protein PilY1